MKVLMKQKIDVANGKTCLPWGLNIRAIYVQHSLLEKSESISRLLHRLFPIIPSVSLTISALVEKPAQLHEFHAKFPVICLWEKIFSSSDFNLKLVCSACYIDRRILQLLTRNLILEVYFSVNQAGKLYITGLQSFSFDYLANFSNIRIPDIATSTYSTQDYLWQLESL